MTQAYQVQDEREEVELSFKRFILDETNAFASEPMADLYRVNILGQMLNRYDELAQHGASRAACIQHVKREFKDIDVWMREEGFEQVHVAGQRQNRWPQMSEDEAALYLKESDNRLHRIALGVAMCTACCAPLMLGAAVSDAFWMMEELAMMVSLCGMLGMIGMGVYAMVTAKKPQSDSKVKRGRFSLSASLRRKLSLLSEAIREKARKRIGKGVVMLVTCVFPIFLGAGIGGVFNADFWPILGVGGMFAMIGAGVYQLIMADGEKKNIKKLLKDK